jgi:preprotein translocase subunit Sss1
MKNNEWIALAVLAAALLAVGMAIGYICSVIANA